MPARHVQLQLVERIHRNSPRRLLWYSVGRVDSSRPAGGSKRRASLEDSLDPPYLFKNSSKFSNWFANIVQAASVGGSSFGSGFDSPTAISFFASSGCAL